MKKNKSYFLLFFLFLIYLSVNTSAFSEIMILSKCKSLKDGFIKNEYTLDLEKSLMIRNYIYDNKTYKKYRVTDLSIKKENSIERFIYEEEEFILTDKVGYPQFFTQLMFKKNSPIINIKTVINKQKNVYEIYNCGSGVPISIKKICHLIVKISKKPLKINFNKNKPTISFDLHLNCEKAEKELGWKPKITIEDGIKKTLIWWGKNIKNA